MHSARRAVRCPNPKRERGSAELPSLTRRVVIVRRPRRAAFSLLEVILALALLGGCVAVLGEVSRLALRNAGLARDLSRAQMLCESKMSEVVSGITAPSNVDKASFDTTMEPGAADDSRWVYSIETDSQAPGEQGLLSVRVTVTKDLPTGQHPVDFSLVRWMLDPNYTQPESSSGTSSSGTSGSNGSSPNSSGGTHAMAGS